MNITEQILNVSVIGAHSNFYETGFRQKDLRFTAELFTNWIDVFLKPSLPIWHNTQAMRFMDKLVDDGYARCTGQGKNKKYLLTRVGLLQLVENLVDISGFQHISHVLLTFYFLKSNRERILALIQRKGSGFSKAIQFEVSHLLDHQVFLNKQIGEHKLQLQRLKIRVSESQQASDLAIKLQRQGEPLSQIIESLSSQHPYELENQKPMAELFKEISIEVRGWEMTQGNLNRSQLLWAPQLQILQAHLKILNELKE